MFYFSPKNNSNCILVGNGAGALRGDHAEIIDSHDIVVRMNRFRVAGYEEVLGTKCTHWVLNCALTTDERNYALNNIEKVRKETNGLLKVLVLTTDSHGREVRLKEIKRVFLSESNVYFDYKIYSTWRMKNLLNGKRKPSTGILAILYFLERYRKLTLIGFDFGTSDHYWGDHGPSDRPGKHHWDAEKQLILKFHEKGRINFL